MPLPPSPTVVITGAAGGFGRAFALLLAARRARLLLSDVNEKGCEETARLALAAGAIETRSMRCDVSKLADVQAMADACTRPVDLVVNNAGIGCGGLIGEVSIEDWRTTIEIDLWGVIHGCHVFVPVLRKQGHGHILNVASAAGLLSPPRSGAYNVAKAGVVSLSETLANEFAGTKLGITVLCPSYTRTTIIANSRFADEDSRRAATKLAAAGKDPDDVARAAIESVDRGELYSVSMIDARWGWRLKRLSPPTFGRVVRVWASMAVRRGARP